MPGHVIVGVDGSDGSVTALRWAVDEARLRNAVLVVVHAWQFPYVGDIAGLAATVRHDEAEQVAEGVLDQSLQAAQPLPDGIEIHRLATPASAAGVLVDLATADDIIVVGTRGRGGFAGLLLGSVSQQTAHHAPCPVVIVPTPGSL